jgi:hypothetical protein
VFFFPATNLQRASSALSREHARITNKAAKHTAAEGWRRRRGVVSAVGGAVACVLRWARGSPAEAPGAATGS